MRTSKTQLVFPKKGSVSPKIYKIRHDTSEKAEKRSYQLQFFEGYRSKIDPKGLVKSLRSRKSYASIAKCHAAAKKIIESVNGDGTRIASVDSNERTQLINLSLQLKDFGIDAAQLLYDSLSMKKLGLDPIDALKTGKTLVTTAKNYDGKTLGDFIKLFENDTQRKKLTTHKATVTSLKALENLSEIKIETLISEELSLAALTKVYQKYCDKPNVDKTSALQTQRRRVNQLLNFVVKKTNLPTQSVREKISRLKNFDLEEDLNPENPIYSFSASEILVLLKFFSHKMSFNPTWIVVSILMGQRQGSIPELKWKNIMPDHRNSDGSWNIKIPWEITKLGRQKRLVQDIVFNVGAVPNLSVWLEWAKNLYDTQPNQNDAIVNMADYWNRMNLMNECIDDYKDLFDFNIERLEASHKSFCYGNLCPNAMRNTWFSLGLKHPVVSTSCNKIGNDYTSTDRYINTEIPNPEEESKVLFSMTPAYLGLVDLKRGTIDKEFLYTNDKDKEIMWELEGDPDKKVVYEKILMDLGIRCPF
tara:strand:- start:84 stop:1676 length:1593 start_codon:yes stop_codon:yes gene_type:complete